MSLVHLKCPRCNQSYEEQGSKKQPRILPCGYSYCSLCVLTDCAENGYFYCEFCDEKIQAQILKYAPINRLYYELLRQVVQYVRMRQWQNSSPKSKSNPRQIQLLSNQIIDYDKSLTIKLQDKCLFTFCQRRRFQCQKIKEPFCSQNCKIRNQQLYE